jgi:hypothetical protein
MTLDEANNAVGAALEHRDDVIDDLLEAHDSGTIQDVVDALDDLALAQEKWHKFLDVWAALDALEEKPKQEVDNAVRSE